MTTPLDALKKGYAELCRSEEFSDCELICGLYHYKLHKVVLSSQSAYFKLAFKADSFKEGKSGVIELKAHEDDTDAQDDACDDPEIVKLMIEYFYHFDYEKGCNRSCSNHVISSAISPDSILNHAKVFAMATKYQVHGLRSLAVSKFLEAVRTGWDHDSFARTIFTVYNSTADDVTGLRDIVADTIHDHFDVLKEKDDVEIIVSSIGGLAYSLLKRSIRTTCTQRHHDASKAGWEVYCKACDFISRCCYRCYNDRGQMCTQCNNHAHCVQ